MAGFEVREDVQEAILAAASSDDESLTKIGIEFHATPSARRIGSVTNIVRRFLEALPDDSLSVRDLVNTLDE